MIGVVCALLSTNMGPPGLMVEAVRFFFQELLILNLVEKKFYY